MTSAVRTAAACLSSALAETFPHISTPVDVMDAAQFPELAEARRHFASPPPERRAELEREYI